MSEVTVSVGTTGENDGRTLPFKMELERRPGTRQMQVGIVLSIPDRYTAEQARKLVQGQLERVLLPMGEDEDEGGLGIITIGMGIKQDPA